MSMQGEAALAMWWDMSLEQRQEFEHWHSHEHFPERLALPGFRRASRWLAADGGERVFVLYELKDHATLSSPGYQQRLNAPTPWSRRMMPHHRNMHRGQCHVLESRGGVVAANLLTIRFSPASALTEEAIRQAWRQLAQELASSPGTTGIHLLRHETPRMTQSTEQRIRGGDQAPECIAVVCAYAVTALEALERRLEAPADAASLGMSPGWIGERYRLSHSALARDVADITA